MKVVAISDTHMRQKDIILPDGDILIHAGDLSLTGTKEEIVNFLMWFSEQPHEYKIFIAGNHDFMFETRPGEMKSYIPDNVIYLENSGINIDGINIWGSPIQPTFYDWAFNVDRGAKIKRYWDLIPDNTDILITHGPPFGKLDGNHNKERVGCEELALAVARIRPKYHIFGHIHQGYGQLSDGVTNFINASLLNEKYIYTNEPIVFNF
ncbi:metallophosphatase domain-containing protein [Pedobacter jamesrossensis]|uniref:Metallophosphatase domain-containing protein n=1 Tax=Pedobacter jamesrossensis TaxID=1908238 RepID=A0ABV8NJM7_9SPHI